MGRTGRQNPSEFCSTHASDLVIQDDGSIALPFVAIQSLCPIAHQQVPAKIVRADNYR
jgi:hypothetical protein